MSVSVVITNYNGRHILQKHLPAVLAATNLRDEVIVVDDASKDDSVVFLEQEFPQVKVIKNATNLRYAQSCNRGVEAAVNELVILLNNDVSPQKGFVESLAAHFEDDKVFAVGCLELNDRGVESGRSVGRFERGMLRHMRAQDQHKTTTLWASGGSMAVRRSLWLKLGGMDRLFRPAYKEDIDLSYRAWKAGYTVLFDHNAVVHHNHETTNSTALGNKEIEIMSYKNEFLFLWKNLTDPGLLFSHWLWVIFYILPVLGVRTRGVVWIGFFRAKLQIFEVVQARLRVKKLWKLTDAQVIAKVEV